MTLKVIWRKEEADENYEMLSLIIVFQNLIDLSGFVKCLIDVGFFEQIYWIFKATLQEFCQIFCAFARIVLDF